MPGLDHYRDTNGITWTVVWPAGKKRFEAIATVEDGADPAYDPVPPDITASMSQGGVQFFGLDIIPSEEATTAQQQTLFLELRGKIDEYAAAHRRDTVLKVTPGHEVPWWVWALGAVLLLKRKR